jgi:hypothetical protein
MRIQRRSKWHAWLLVALYSLLGFVIYLAFVSLAAFTFADIDWLMSMIRWGVTGLAIGLSVGALLIVAARKQSPPTNT